MESIEKKELTRQSHGKVEVIIYIRCQTMVDVEKQQAVGVKWNSD